MGRRFINQLVDQEPVDDIFLAQSKQLRPNRNGDLYLQVDLCDRSGTISALLWNADEETYRSFEPGDFVAVRGTAQLYQGSMQVIASKVRRAHNPNIDEADFFRLGPQAIDRLATRLSEILRSMSDPQLRNLAECFLMDETFMRKLSRAPAGIKHHHAYHGGLLEHIVNMMDVAMAICPFYPQIDRDQLIMGCFLHDMGKIEELTFEKSFGYSDTGQMIGHLVIGVSQLEEKIREAERLSGETFPEDLALRLKHMIVSHHGEYEYGSPKLPMTLEALALHYLDNLDAKMHAFHQLMQEDPGVEGNFTLYNQNLRRKLYKGKPGN